MELMLVILLLQVCNLYEGITSSFFSHLGIVRVLPLILFPLRRTHKHMLKYSYVKMLTHSPASPDMTELLRV